MALQEPPTNVSGIVRRLGPGLIITASIVGSGELIVTPKLGAEVGFTLLWFIIFGCLVKVFIQVELGRYAVSRGMTTLEAMNTMPGPRFIVSWLLWLWAFMFVAIVIQVGGIISGVSGLLVSAGAPAWTKLWTFLIGLSCAVILIMGRYRLVQSVSTVMVALFTLFTVFAVVALAWTPYEVTSANIIEGLSFQLPDNFTTAFAAFGIIGVGASELIYYPYWCLEKGYANFVGPKDDSEEWYRRANGWVRVMRIDAWFSMFIYTGATIAFYILGAAVLHGKGLQVTNDDMIPTLSQMYREAFGAWGLMIFMIGAFMVLYSTAFVATASNARLFADGLALFKIKKYNNSEERMMMIKVGCALLPLVAVLSYWLWDKPVYLVFVGAVAQGLMLPFLGIAAVYFRFKRTDRQLAPGHVWTFFLALAAACMIAVGLFQVVTQLNPKETSEPAPAAAQQSGTISTNAP